MSGFTLIELMVVLVIIAVLLSAMTQAFRFGKGDQLRAEEAKIRGLLVTLNDQASFDGKPYLLSPMEEGLKAWVFRAGEWQVAEAIADHKWQESLEYRWQLDQQLKQRRQLPVEGWVFWPSGEVSEGFIGIEAQESGEDSIISRWIEWNGVLEFSDSVPE